MASENGKVLFLSQPKRFTLEEARAILPEVQEITEEAVEEATPVIMELSRTDLSQEEREEFNKELQIKANAWAKHITRLGAVVKGLWLVDFDSGNGFYCWTYNEPTIDHFHSYDEGFGQRTPIQ